jgi:hypothetical protein
MYWRGSWEILLCRSERFVGTPLMCIREVDGNSSSVYQRGSWELLLCVLERFMGNPPLYTREVLNKSSEGRQIKKFLSVFFSCKKQQKLEFRSP